MGVTEKAVLYSRSRFSCELSEIGAAKPDGARLLREAQPPSGGCVLKQLDAAATSEAVAQPPSGGCVLKPGIALITALLPPSRLQAAVC